MRYYGDSFTNTKHELKSYDNYFYLILKYHSYTCRHSFKGSKQWFPNKNDHVCYNIFVDAFGHYEMHQEQGYVQRISTDRKDLFQNFRF